MTLIFAFVTLIFATRYDDLWIGDGSLRKHNEIGGGTLPKFLAFLRNVPKLELLMCPLSRK